MSEGARDLTGLEKKKGSSTLTEREKAGREEGTSSEGGG